MINIKCFYCGKSFPVNPDAISTWLEAHQQEQPKTYPAQCLFCRRVIKVPLKQIERSLPKTAEAAAQE